MGVGLGHAGLSVRGLGTDQSSRARLADPTVVGSIRAEEKGARKPRQAVPAVRRGSQDNWLIMGAASRVARITLNNIIIARPSPASPFPNNTYYIQSIDITRQYR